MNRMAGYAMVSDLGHTCRHRGLQRGPHTMIRSCISNSPQFHAVGISLQLPIQNGTRISGQLGSFPVHLQPICGCAGVLLVGWSSCAVQPKWIRCDIIVHFCGFLFVFTLLFPSCCSLSIVPTTISCRLVPSTASHRIVGPGPDFSGGHDDYRKS